MAQGRLAAGEEPSSPGLAPAWQGAARRQHRPETREHSELPGCGMLRALLPSLWSASHRAARPQPQGMPAVTTPGPDRLWAWHTVSSLSAALLPSFSRCQLQLALPSTNLGQAGAQCPPVAPALRGLLAWDSLIIQHLPLSVGSPEGMQVGLDGQQVAEAAAP